jgi:hypothetical protein
MAFVDFAALCAKNLKKEKKKKNDVTMLPPSQFRFCSNNG